MSMMIFALSLATAASPAASNPLPAANQAAQPARTSSAQDRKYCIAAGAITGSRMTRGKKVCRTKAEWAREGIDVDDL